MADYIISCHATYPWTAPVSQPVEGIGELVFFKNHAGTLRIEKSQKIFDSLLASGDTSTFDQDIWARMPPGRMYPKLKLEAADTFASGIFRVGGKVQFAIKKYGNGWTGWLDEEVRFLSSQSAGKVFVLACATVVSSIDVKEVNKYFAQDYRTNGTTEYLYHGA